MDFISLFVYGSILLVSSFFAYKTTTTPNKTVYIVLAYAVIVLVSALRYDVGFDYLNYVDAFKQIQISNEYYFEKGFLFLNILFSNQDLGYVYVFAVSAGLIYYYVFRALICYNVIWPGVFLIITNQYFFMANNQIRSSIAISIFMFSLGYLEKGRYLLYLINISLAAMLFHASATVALLILFIKKLPFNRFIWIFILFTSYILYYFGFYERLGEYALNYLYEYNAYEKFSGTDRNYIESTTHPIIVLYWTLLSIFVAFLYRPTENNLIVNSYLFGALLYTIFCDYHVLARVVLYFTSTGIIAISIVYKKDPKRGSLLLFYCLIIFVVYCINNWGMDGGYPYRTVFSM